MIFLLISIVPFFLLLSKSAHAQPFPAWATEFRLLLSVFFWQEFLHCSKSLRGLGTRLSTIYLKMSYAKRKRSSRVGNAEKVQETTFMDLPDLALDLILEKLPPAALCSMATACRSMRELCRSDYIWEKHMRARWGKVIGPAAKREWEWYLATSKDSSSDRVERSRKRTRWWSLLNVWPLCWIKSRIERGSKEMSPLVDDSIMSWYLSLETGRFWFPAQVYNRENGHVGFMMSCYDAVISYDNRTNTFRARYPPHGRRAAVVEEGVHWDRIRAPVIDSSAHDLHTSDCLHDLRPGDHIEIQWSRNKEFPYGWWYGIVGHLEPCDGSAHFCRCHQSETVVLEFNQYTSGSRWRRTTINRKDHREEGNETDGFYGGIRKLYAKDEINTWKKLWPVEVLE